MNITILNGNPVSSPFDTYLTQVQSGLEGEDHTVTRLDLRDMPLRYCVGCWGCWVKTPGECVNRDASLEMGRAVIQSDFTLWAAPLKMGFPAALLKMANDKHLPLIHPYMVVDHGEAHHLKRYARYPRLGLLLEKEAATDERDLQIVTAVYCRTALNFKTRLEFCLTTETSAAEVAARITTPNGRPLPLPGRLEPIAGTSISPPTRLHRQLHAGGMAHGRHEAARLTLFNGSPRGRRGNTPILLEQFANGFGGPTVMHHLIQVKQTERFVQAFAEAECAWI
ncbi:MAG: hypothetical protein ABIJ39_03990, partial [Chloroflexota bacterium]